MEDLIERIARAIHANERREVPRQRGVGPLGREPGPLPGERDRPWPRRSGSRSDTQTSTTSGKRYFVITWTGDEQ